MIKDILGSDVTNNLQITKLCKHIIGDDYLGTFSSDKMPNYI